MGEDLSGKTFCIWGLAFKPGTDDMREASSLVLIETLVMAGAKVQAYDPVSMAQAKKEMPESWQDKVCLAEDPYQALDGVSACILVTEWKNFRQPDFKDMKRRMAEPVIFDGRKPV